MKRSVATHPRGARSRIGRAAFGDRSRTSRLRSLARVLLLASLAACGGDASEGGSVAGEPLFGQRPAEGLDLRITVEPTEVELLAPIEVTLDLFVAEGVVASFEPSVPDGLAGRFVLDGSARREFVGDSQRGAFTRWRATLRPTELGTLTIPPFEVRSTDGALVANTSAIELTVTSLLPDDADRAAVEAPAPLFPASRAVWPFVLGGAALLLLAFTAIAWRRWRARRLAARQQTDGTPLPPHIKAQRALALLRKAPRMTPNEIERFYVEVSNVLRVYLEERFGLHAPERTTEEFLPEVERSGVLDAGQRGHLRRFLEQCDLVKFAALRPGEDVHTETFAFAEDFVESTRPDRSVAETVSRKVPEVVNA